MQRRLAVVAGLAVGLALAVVAFAPADTEPGPQIYSASTPPRSGHIFTAFVEVWPPEARAEYASVDINCWGVVFARRTNKQLRRVEKELARYPEGAAVPSVVVLTFKIPPKTVGKRFGYGCSGTTVKVSGVGQHGDGAAAPRWIIRP
jgi:hypothetical protein